MKICLINNLYKPYNRGGAEVYLENLYRGFEKRGDEVFVISTKPHNGNLKEDLNSYYLKSFFYNLEKMPKIFRLIWHFFNVFDILKYFSVKKIIKEENPDLIITNNLIGLGFLLPGLFKRKGIKHIHVLHDIQILHPSGLMYLGGEDIIDSFFAKIYQRVNRYLFRNIEFVISPSDWLLDLHKKRGFFSNSKTKVILNPIEVISLEVEKKDERGRRFLYVGQIEKHKGVEELFRVMYMFLEKNDFSFCVIGDGSLFKELSLKYSDRIKFLGKKEKNDVYREMLNSDCLLVTSLCYENSPTVIYEAALMNINFIYPELGGALELGQYFNGFSYDPQKKGSLGAIIGNCLEGDSKVIVQNKKVLNLSTSRYIENILTIF